MDADRKDFEFYRGDRFKHIEQNKHFIRAVKDGRD